MSDPTAGEPVGARVACIVVPCFNEALRLDRAALLELVGEGSVRLLFVDDGSTDHTAAVLRELEAASEAIRVHTLDRNHGKAEAVRRGLIAACTGPEALIGYYDADLATPPEELLRLVAVLASRPEIACVLGARVALLGSVIQRRAFRHYAGRLFASAASAALGVAVYDTQCGAKVFRRSAALDAAIAAPFRSRWAFDVELLARLLRGNATVAPIAVDALLEVPLRSWRDIPGSGLRAGGVLSALADVGRIGAARCLKRPTH